MADEKTQEAQVTEVKTGVTKMGFSQLSNPTPLWVTWVFRTEFVLNKAAMLWLSATQLVPTARVKEIVLTLTIVDFVVWGLGRFVGISKDQMESK